VSLYYYSTLRYFTQTYYMLYIPTYTTRSLILNQLVVIQPKRLQVAPTLYIPWILLHAGYNSIIIRFGPTGVFGRVRPIRAIVSRLSSLPRRRPLRRTWPRTPPRSTTGHVVRYHIDDARQCATPTGGAHEVRDTIQSKYLKLTLYVYTDLLYRR